VPEYTTPMLHLVKEETAGQNNFDVALEKELNELPMDELMRRAGVSDVGSR
jgi:hypothetical protein